MHGSQLGGPGRMARRILASRRLPRAGVLLILGLCTLMAICVAASLLPGAFRGGPSFHRGVGGMPRGSPSARL